MNHRMNKRRPRAGRRAGQLWLAACWLFLLTLALGCRPTPTPLPAIRFRIGSADSTQYLAREAADAYRRARPTTTFDFFTSNSSMALRQLALNQFDFAFIERNPRADELARARAAALELGRDGVFVVVHPTNALQTIARDALKKVLTGEVNQWSQLNAPAPGGQDAIQVISREDGSGMRAVIEEQVMQGARLTPTALLLPTNLDVLAYVADHPNAIGYVAANIWDENSRTRPLAIDNVAATRATIADGTYPLIQTVFLIVPQPPSPTVSNFLEFLASNEGRTTLYRRISELTPQTGK